MKKIHTKASIVISLFIDIYASDIIFIHSEIEHKQKLMEKPSAKLMIGIPIDNRLQMD
jgi:hypothetical protein